PALRPGRLRPRHADRAVLDGRGHRRGWPGRPARAAPPPNRRRGRSPSRGRCDAQCLAPEGGRLTVSSARSAPAPGHPSPFREMRGKGRALRSPPPRDAHAELRLPDRDPVGIITRQNEGRLADLVPVRIGRMLESPFAYYRGTAAVMAHDLTAGPVTGPRVVCCGDAHISNFGL